MSYSIINDIDFSEEKTFPQLELKDYLDEPKYMSGSHVKNIKSHRGGDKNASERKFAETIDSALTKDSLLSIIHSEVLAKGIIGHHIASIDNFYREGISEIIKTAFGDALKARMKNLRGATPEDQTIDEIEYDISFTRVMMTTPTIGTYGSNGKSSPLTPAVARSGSLTYSGGLYVDIDIVVTAHLKTGGIKKRSMSIKNHRIAAIPVMVGSSLCNTYMLPRQSRKEIFEDPNDEGGYFIINGNEWCIDNLENLAPNVFHVHKNMYKEEIVRGTFLSKPGDSFENSYQIIVRLLRNGNITVELSMSQFAEIKIPFYMFFRALGIASDKDIINHITYGFDHDQITTHMLQILETSFGLPLDPKIFPKKMDPRNRIEIIDAIATRLSKSKTLSKAKKDENVVKHLYADFHRIIDEKFFPHIGTSEQHRIPKLRFLGHLINVLIKVEMGIVESSDRDSYKNKRIHSSGTSLSKAFKTNFNLAIIMEIKKTLKHVFETNSFSDVKLDEIIISAIKTDDLERLMTSSIISGNKTIIVRKKEITNRISSQTLSRKNDLNSKATLCIVNTSNTFSSKQNDRADVMRRVHPSSIGYIDISYSKDTGEGVGITKQLAITASITLSTSSYNVKKILLADPDIVPFDKVAPEDINIMDYAKVFVNGDLIGCCVNAQAVATKYRALRRRDELNHTVTISAEVLTRELKFSTDVGRLLRPLIIVYNNADEYKNAWRTGVNTVESPHKVSFRQWIRLTAEDIANLQCGRQNIEGLRKAGIIEYISPEEQENLFLAQSLDVLRERAADPLYQFTHLEIEQTVFGLLTLSSPFADHSSAVRVTYYTNHRKDSAGWYCTNYPYRMDKNAVIQYYCETPLVNCIGDKYTYPNGQNAIVALMQHTGKNQEDSIEGNRSSVDCGLYNACFYTYEKTELNPGEQIGDIEKYKSKCSDIKKADYSKLADGLIKVGSLVIAGTVLVCKVAKNPKGVFPWVDRSLVAKGGPAVVERVITTRKEDDTQVIKIQLRSVRHANVGDKQASRTGNKGIISSMIDRCDMPYTEDGLVPDLIISSQSIVTRMAPSQLIECALGILCARQGRTYDATVFKKIDEQLLYDELAKIGIKYGGARRMYNGKTGEWIDTLIFIGPTTYQRLQKFVADVNYAMYSGPVNAIFRQPLDGKVNNGGLRLGEMEVWCKIAHGTSRALHEKLFDDSDGTLIYICKNCSNRAIVNESIQKYICNYCAEYADIVAVKHSWSANVFLNTLASMNAKMLLKPAPTPYNVSK